MSASAAVRTLIMSIAALTSLPFSDACDQWLDSRRPYLAEKTQYEYGLSIQTLSKFFGELRVQEIDGDLVRAYQRMRQQSVGSSAINHELNVFIQVRKRIGLPLTDYQALPLPKEERGRALSPEERERLFRTASSNPGWESAYLFALIAVNTTAGPKEVMTLRLRDVDIGRGTIRIQPEGVKNIHRIRTIPLNAEALAAVNRALLRAQSLGAVEEDHYLFPFRVYGGQNPKYDPARHQMTMKTSWTSLREAAKLHGLRMYDLRHHAITAMLENPDISEETIEDIAGHVSRRMKKRYSHIRMEYKRRAVDILAERYEDKPKRKPVRAEKSTGTKKATKNKELIVQQLAEVLGKLLNSA